MKELKLFTFASDSENPSDIVNFLKGKTNLIVAIKLADLALAKVRNRFIVIKSNIDDFKVWEALDSDYLNKTKNYHIVDVINTLEFDNAISRIDADIKNIDEEKVRSAFIMPFVMSFRKSELNDRGVLRYLDSTKFILDLIEGGVSVEEAIKLANKKTFMSNVNKFQYINNSCKQLSSRTILDFDLLAKAGIEVIFGNSLICFGITKSKDIILISFTLDKKRKGEFDNHPLLRLLNNNFYNAKPI
nr:MAG TPA: hypothetical protein [Caudoviricetes sp.]